MSRPYAWGGLLTPTLQWTSTTKMNTEAKLRDGASVRGVTVPPEFDDVVAWAAWLYYVDELTQSEIAAALSVSRATIVKLLQDARERGAVTIRIDQEAASRTRLSRDLSSKFKLAAAYVIPTLPGVALTPRLGEAGARVLAQELRSGDTVGVAWGRTVLAVAEKMPQPDESGPFTVVQVCGSSAGSAVEFSPELCSSVLASRIKARCANLLAPAVLSNTKLREQLLAEPPLINQFALIRSADRVLFGVGDLAGAATVRAADLASPEEIDAYVKRGAVGVLLGRFIDREGRHMIGDLDSRMIGITLDELKALPNRLCVAGGPEKIRALRAALRGGYITHLVTDAAAAASLLDAKG
jgi:DNA-binding transcriptional regulator LsrR (DeoR family)